MKDALITIAIILVFVALIACQATIIAKKTSYLAPAIMKICPVAGDRTAEIIVPTWPNNINLEQ